MAMFGGMRYTNAVFAEEDEAYQPAGSRCAASTSACHVAVTL